MQKFEYAEVSTEATNDKFLRTIKKVREFISRGNIAANDMTLLLLAAEYGHLDIVKYIIDKGLRL